MQKDYSIGDEYLKTINFFTPIQEQILQVENRMRVNTNGHHLGLRSALDHLLTSGGKRIRPAVVLLTGRMLGAELDGIVALAAAIELLHTATLVHDDLIDGALIRRGIATLNANWTPAATVLTGDYFFAQAAKLAAETNSIRLMSMFAETLLTIVNGEINQLFSSFCSFDRQEYDQRIYAKTASLFELSASAAALLSPVSENIVRGMNSFGYNLGMAFQIIDDILDFTGEQTDIGKPVASDLRNKIITLPTICYYEQNKNDPILKSLTMGDLVSDDMIDQLVLSIKSSGAIDLAFEEAGHHIERALATLTTHTDSKERCALEDLARFIVHRYY